MSALTLTAERPALGPLLAAVIPLGRPGGAAREPRVAEVPVQRGVALDGPDLGAGLEQGPGLFLRAVVDMQHVARLLEVAGHAAGVAVHPEDHPGQHAAGEESHRALDRLLGLGFEVLYLLGGLGFDRRGIGDIWTMTVQEYHDATPWRRLCYRVSRSPVVLFGVDKVTKYHMEAPLYVTTFAYTMNKDRYNSMSPAQKKVIDDHCNTEWAGKIGGPWADFEHDGIAKIKAEPGQEVYTITAEQLGEWRKAAEPLQKSWADNVKKAGGNPDAIMKELQDSLKKYSASY